ncbi:2OG-Fe(II) oxygenase superfamily protein [Pseudoxanthomonas sp. GM95]|uniref:2OG-Fe(II) oxygenase n=1 Tax=Pseudoxanthomonas sp. GM95 TaxID=1881043 RepID=UPI0008CE8D2E|nr:2OG-Fe(II) oxygenase [Pseudoxanthomonas sp. GM95]SEL09974.1 2OG-Fe(II) oxygenase superfamily protein [Pseudoxanthomonas sp. GM95]
MVSGAGCIVIRGRQLELDGLVDCKIRDPAYRKRLQQDFEHAFPFPHLRLDTLFDPVLLQLVREEFDLYPARGWRSFSNAQEQTYRSLPGHRFGPASRLYFDVVNSSEFVEFLSEISGIKHLIVDCTLFGGGLHESRNGGKFGMHRDFDLHAETGLANEMVFLTYLNPDWDPAWGGALELWDTKAERSVVHIQPELGTCLLMKNQADSYHGHPEPMRLPEGIKRRSLASYYYTNPCEQEYRAKARTTVFLSKSRSALMRDGSLRLARRWSPPVVWDFARRVRMAWAKR